MRNHGNFIKGGMAIKIKIKELGLTSKVKNPNSFVSVHKEPTKLYNKKNKFPIIKDRFTRFYLCISSFVTIFMIKVTNVSAIDKIEGGNITIESLATIIKNLATKIQIFGIVLAFVALVVFTVQFIIGDDETKQRRKKTILYTLSGVALLILVPSIINFVIDLLG